MLGGLGMDPKDRFFMCLCPRRARGLRRGSDRAHTTALRNVAFALTEAVGADSEGGAHPRKRRIRCSSKPDTLRKSRRVIGKKSMYNSAAGS